MKASKATPAREWSGNAIGLVKSSRKRLARAIVLTQGAIAEAEQDGDCNPSVLSRIARQLRLALTDLDCVPHEVESAVEGAAADGLPAERPRVNGPGGEE